MEEEERNSTITMRQNAEVYATRVVPCVHALMSTPSQQFITFVHSFLEQWPPNVTAAQFLAFFPKTTRKLHECESVLANELWGVLRDHIDNHVFLVQR